MKNRVKKADEVLERFAQNEMDIVYFASCVVLAKEYGWKKVRIKRFIDVTSDIFHECAGMDKSLVQMCDEEAGIEFRTKDGKSWKDMPYLNTEKWKAMQKQFFSMPIQMQNAWMIRMKKRQEEWMRPQLVASVALALYRKEGWAFQRISKFVAFLEETMNDYNDDSKALLEAVNEYTGLKYGYTQKHELVLLNAREIDDTED